MFDILCNSGIMQNFKIMPYFSSACNFHRSFRIKQLHYRQIGKDVRFGPDVKSLMLEGVDILADAVSVTMGPKGRTVVIEQPFGPPKITKDGVTVAKEINLQNKFQNIGVKIVQAVADKTNEEAGDGTTTATILARAIVTEALQNISTGSNPFEIRKGVMIAVNAVVEKIKSLSKPLTTPEDIAKIATLSANGDMAIGELIANAINKVGKDGVVIIKTGRTLKDEIEIQEGMKIDRGFLSAYFINSNKGPKVEYENALVLFAQKKIFTAQQILPALEICRHHKKPLVIITEDIEEEPLSVLLVNKLNIGLPVVAVKAPGFGQYRKDVLFDMAIATGGVVFEDDLNLIRIEDCILQSLGKVGEVVITKDSTLLINGAGEKKHIVERIEEIKADVKKQTKEYDRTQLLDRLSRLQSRVAVLLIGGYSEMEANEKKDRINDALNATRAALAEGMVPGGGSTLIRCISTLDKLKPSNNDQAIGISVVRKALSIPCTTIANNAGVEGLVVAAKVEKLENEFGYDALNNEYVNMMEKGIMDPTKVVRRALIDASGIASLLTTAEAVICDLKENEKCPPKYKGRGSSVVGHV